MKKCPRIKLCQAKICRTINNSKKGKLRTNTKLYMKLPFWSSTQFSGTQASTSKSVAQWKELCFTMNTP